MDKNIRTILFFCVCIPVRLFLAYFIQLISVNKPNILKAFGFIFLLPVIMWLYYVITDSKKIGFFGGKVWWNNYRIVHSISYLTFILLVFINIKYSSYPLYIDSILALIFGLQHYLIKL